MLILNSRFKLKNSFVFIINFLNPALGENFHPATFLVAFSYRTGHGGSDFEHPEARGEPENPENQLKKQNPGKTGKPGNRKSRILQRHERANRPRPSRESRAVLR